VSDIAPRPASRYISAMSRYDVSGPWPYDPDLTRDYDLVPADSAIGALYRVQLDGLGPASVRLVNGRIVFTDPADRAWAAGVCRVVPRSQNSAAETIESMIPAVFEGDGKRAA
jgi:hypothetical protein